MGKLEEAAESSDDALAKAVRSASGLPWFKIEALAVGVPGGGGVVRATDLALLYQGYLHDPAGLWSPEVLVEGTGFDVHLFFLLHTMLPFLVYSPRHNRLMFTLPCASTSTAERNARSSPPPS